MTAREITPAAGRRLVVPVLVGAILVLILLYLAMPWISGTAFVRRWTERAVSRATQFDVDFKRLRLGYDGSLTVELASAAERGRPPFVTAKRMQVQPNPLAWIRGRIGTVSVESPHVYVDLLPAPSDEPRGEILFPFDLVNVVEGVMHLSSGDREVALGPLTLSVDHVAAGAGLRLGGEAQLTEAATDVHWSAQVGSQLRTVEGEIVVKVAELNRLSDHVFAAAVPAPLRAATVDLTTRFHGTPTNRIAATIEMQVQAVGQKHPLRFTGSADIEAAAAAAVVTLKGSDLRLANADSSAAIEGVDVESTWKMHRRPGKPPRLEFDASLRSGEVLWDRIYVDLARNRLHASGTVQGGDRGEMRLENGRVTFGGVGTLALSGSHDAQRTALQVTADLPAVGNLYDLAVRDPLREEYPVVGRAAVGGRAKIAVDVERTSASDRVTGTVQVNNGTLSIPDPSVHVADLSVNMPIDLASAPVDGRSRPGTLGIGPLQIGGVAVDHMQAQVDVEPNRLQLRGPVAASLLGGVLELSALQAEQLASADRAASVSLALRNLDLGQLSRAVGWPFLNGTISGSIPKMTLSNGQLISDGEIEIKAFNGRILMRNLKVDQLFSRVPAIGLDLDIENVSLARLTHEFEVGQITGIVSGGVRDLSIVNGEPVKFEAWMQNNAHSDEAQRISVAAIRQLAILGGSGGDPLTQGLLSFFDEYRYAKIGFRARLENDQFILRGVEERDGKQYLVVGAKLPPRVDVVSHNPIISFSEMMSRLDRIFAQPPAEGPSEAPPAGEKKTPAGEHRDGEGQTATGAERGERSSEIGGSDR